uniref:Uncharacterized protein n=1 Tax=Vombatus ursinus TaxID=29139 RepID=A0A4X2KFR3_VOMUR
MAFDDLLLEVISLAISLMFIASHFLLENFTAFVPEHRCWVHFLDSTSALLNVSGNLNFSSLLKLSIPLDSNGKLEKYHRFFWPQWQPLGPNVTAQNVSQLEMEPCVDGWVYNQSVFTSSIVTEWDLVCDSWTLKSLPQSIFFAGILVGFLMWGCLSDRFGRKWILPPSYLIVTVSSTVPAFAQSFPVYCCLRFLLGSRLCLKLILYWVTFGLCISLGQLFIGVLACGIQEWCKLQLVMSAPLFTFFPTTWWLPESAGWLIVHNKYDDALKMLRKVAKINGVMDNNLTVEVRGEGGARARMWELVTFQVKPSKPLHHVGFGPLPHLRTRILSMLFYGLFMDLQNLGSNVQTLQVLLGASTFVSKFLTLFIMNHLGLRTIAVACLLLAGLFILANAFLPQGKRVGFEERRKRGVGVA